ncbi:Protein trichome birefringence-like 2, partial [Bienertia sinuspersici]
GYNCTIDYVRAPFLVRKSSIQKKNESLATLRLNLMYKTTHMHHDAHILVFNTNHWWTHEKTSREEDYYQEGNHVHPQLKALRLVRRPLPLGSDGLTGVLIAIKL